MGIPNPSPDERNPLIRAPSSAPCTPPPLNHPKHQTASLTRRGAQICTHGFSSIRISFRRPSGLHRLLEAAATQGARPSRVTTVARICLFSVLNSIVIFSSMNLSAEEGEYQQTINSRNNQDCLTIPLTS